MFEQQRHMAAMQQHDPIAYQQLQAESRARRRDIAASTIDIMHYYPDPTPQGRYVGPMCTEQEPCRRCRGEEKE